MKKEALIAIFCAAGGLTRYYISGWIYSLFGVSFPFGTLLVNIIGAYFIGLFMELGLTYTVISESLRIAITTGFMGGLTTFSTFSYETFRLMEDGRIAIAAMNIIISVSASLLFTWFGIFTVRSIY